MVHAEQAIPSKPCLPPLETRMGRLRWLAEELCELANAWGLEFETNNRGTAVDNFSCWAADKPMYDERDPAQALSAIVDAYDANIDLLVFTIGNGVASGTALEPGWQEVHGSNMSKFIDGHKREDGKWIKGPSYRRANLKPIIEAQLANEVKLCDKPAA